MDMGSTMGKGFTMSMGPNMGKGSTLGTDNNMGTDFTIELAIQEKKSIDFTPISSTPIKIAHSVQNCIFRF